MSIFSSRLVLALCISNFLLLIGGGVYLAFYDGEQLPQAKAILPEGLLVKNTTRQQRNPVQLASLTQRPVFHQNRKEYIVKKVILVKKQTPKRSTPLTAYQLKGIVYIKGGNSFIILRHKNSGKNYKLRMGDHFGEWTVKSISKASVKFTRGGESAQLSLIKPRNRRK